MNRSGFARLANDGGPEAFTHRLPAALAKWWTQNQADPDGLATRGFKVAQEVTLAHDLRTHTATGGAWDVGATPITLTREIVAKDPDVAADRERQKRLAVVHGEVANLRRDVVGDDPAQITTYDRKGELARLALANDTAAIALIALEADATGVTVADLSASIIGKADAWMSATMALEGKRRAFASAITAATTVAELDAIADPDFAPIRTALGLPAGEGV